MAEAASGALELNVEADIVLCRQQVRRLTQQIKFSLVDQTKMITAASELARNTVAYGLGGEMRWDFPTAPTGGMGLRLIFDDKGPGIADIDRALTDGWTSGTGMGVGLSGSRRLVNQFDIQSAPGEGTSVTIVRWK